MKICNNCGATLNDNAFVCSNCGTQLPMNYPVYQQSTPKTPISVGGWIGRTLIPCIPLVGGIVYLVMLFIWSGDTSKEDTFRNWAKAQLIVMAVVIVLSIILGVLFGVAYSDLLASM